MAKLGSSHGAGSSPWLLGAALMAVMAEGAVHRPQETPEEYQEAVEEASRLGGTLFQKYRYLRLGQKILEAEYPDAMGVENTVLAAADGDVLVRFIGWRDLRPRVLYEVRFDDEDRGEVSRLDPPAKPTLLDAMAFFSKRAALEASPIECADEYVAVLGRSEGIDSPRDVYLVPVTSKEGEIAIGGFGRVTMGSDGQTVLAAEALSKSCLTMSKPDETGGEPFLVASHILSSTPLATHVFVSLLHQQTLVLATDAGNWGIAATQIVYLGPPTDEECCDEVLAEAGGPPTPAAIPEDWSHASEASSEPAPWRERLVVWRPTDAPSPWLEDDRLRDQSPPEYPSDFPVVFAPDRDGSSFEMMWVRVFAHDSGGDRYLGHLLNPPHFLQSVAQGDRIVFGYDETLELGLARHDDWDYEVLTVPPAALGGDLEELYQGIVHFRKGESGHVQEEIRACVNTLTGVVAREQPALDREHRYLAHYILGRCLAEAYETDRAIEQFERAIELEPHALDPQMALLAELCVKVYKKPESERLEKRYLDQLELVRERYGENERVALILQMLFDPKNSGDISHLSEREVARRRRVGFGVFRWKMP